MMHKPPREFVYGDRVAFSRSFLRSTHAITGEQAHLRGTVKVVERVHQGKLLCRIHWDDGHASSALSVNLVLESRIHLEAH